MKTFIILLFCSLIPHMYAMSGGNTAQTFESFQTAYFHELPNCKGILITGSFVLTSLSCAHKTANNDLDRFITLGSVIQIMQSKAVKNVTAVEFIKLEDEGVILLNIPKIRSLCTDTVGQALRVPRLPGNPATYYTGDGQDKIDVLFTTSQKIEKGICFIVSYVLVCQTPWNCHDEAASLDVQLTQMLDGTFMLTVVGEGSIGDVDRGAPCYCSERKLPGYNVFVGILDSVHRGTNGQKGRIIVMSQPLLHRINHRMLRAGHAGLRPAQAQCNHVL